MRRKTLHSKHFDLCHTIMFNEFPAEYIKTIGVPGKFIEKINQRVHLKDGTGGEMDSAFILDPDGDILKERVSACLEHQSTPVNPTKLNKFGDYDIQLVSDENLPTLLIVASHLNPEESKNMLIRSPSDITKLYFLDLGEENICKRLNTVSKIIENKKYINNEIALNLGVILLYAPRKHACKITEKVSELYVKIVKELEFKMEYCLYSVITIMIDAYFDDENKYRRMINMVEKNTSKKTKEAFAETKKSLMNSIQWTKEDLAKANEKIDKLEAENSRIPKLEAENSRIPELEAQIEAQNSIIPELKAEIERLTAKLNGK